MAIADWFISKSQASIAVHLEIGAPIDGTGSLRMANDGLNAEDVSHVRLMAPNPASQFLKGKVRTLLQPIAFTDAAGSESFMGCIGMMNQANAWDTSGVAYYAGRWGGLTPSWWIARGAGPLNTAADFTMLASGDVTNLPGLGVVKAMEFEWVYDPLEFNGVRLILRVGAMSDFSDLAQIYSVVDTGPSSLTTTVGEGLFTASVPASAGPVVECLYDKTTVFELVPV